MPECGRKFSYIPNVGFNCVYNLVDTTGEDQFPHIEADQVVGFAIAMGKLVLAGGIDEVVDTIETNIRNI